jgi:23S rRNA (adenine2503-C2)-methyltransferase
MVQTSLENPVQAVAVQAPAQAPAPPSLYGLVAPELTELLASWGEKPYRGGQILQWLYARRVTAFEEMTNLSAALRERLARETTLALPQYVRRTGSEDTTQKFLFRLADGAFVESVLIPATPGEDGERATRRTLCVSSQVGCAYGCKFCASGLEGWKRHLRPEEIVGQFLVVERMSGERIDNIVFMGMGEPMANYPNVLKAITIINADWGPQVGARHITVSTSGLVPRIKDLADQPLQIRLAISLHGARDEVRMRIMPVNKKYPLAQLREACLYYQERKKQKIGFEYILIKDVNDSLEDARALAHWLRDMNAKVNLIPYNTVEGLEWARPSIERQQAFWEVLHQRGIRTTLRREKGHDIDAACGQLRLRHEKEVDAQAALAV